MKYEFNFKETNYGSISIEARTTPTRAEVIEAIMAGNAYYKDTDYEDIRLISGSKDKPKPNRDHSR